MFLRQCPALSIDAYKFAGAMASRMACHQRNIKMKFAHSVSMTALQKPINSPFHGELRHVVAKRSRREPSTWVQLSFETRRNYGNCPATDSRWYRGRRNIKPGDIESYSATINN